MPREGPGIGSNLPIYSVLGIFTRRRIYFSLLFSPAFSIDPLMNDDMPGLTNNTNQPPSLDRVTRDSLPKSHPFYTASPTRPPVSPITPPLNPKKLDDAPSSSTTGELRSPAPPQQPQKIYRHPNQEAQEFIPLPVATKETVDLDDNPDAIALKNTISVLQIQRQTAISDMKTLQKIKKRALADPEGFADDLASGRIKTRAQGMMSYKCGSESEDNEQDASGIKPVTDGTDSFASAWPELPTPQNIVEAPVINWAEYGVMGESLDKLHDEQMRNPVGLKPTRLDIDRRVSLDEYAGTVSQRPILAATGPGGTIAGKGTLVMEKMGTRRGGKR